jgi:hypothetical protein
LLQNRQLDKLRGNGPHTEERNRWFGPDEDKLRKLQGDIAELREKLGFAALDLAKGQQEESEEAEQSPSTGL